MKFYLRYVEIVIESTVLLLVQFARVSFIHMIWLRDTFKRHGHRAQHNQPYVGGRGKIYHVRTRLLLRFLKREDFATYGYMRNE